ncbi:MAG: GNAT family N-acetyltransferase [Mucilaginibacter polytrichastri]|nr:GNAT family N-acetyltransferase [Mucilaginibacter polytrichastri]
MNGILQNDRVVLVPLSDADAGAFYAIYADPVISVRFGNDLFLPGETALAFTRRIAAQCARIYTIRETAHPETIIGDCALHHYDAEKQEAQIGGTLLPQYQGKKRMTAAFTLLFAVAKQELHVHTLIGATQNGNEAAIRLAESLGFTRQKEDDDTLYLRKTL